MNIDNLKKDKLGGLEERLILSCRERLKVLLDKSSGADFKKNHLFKKYRRDIARILTLMSEFKKKV